MKYIKICCAVIAASLIFAGSAFAIPPENIAASYDASSGTVTITASHAVNDGKKHYIMSMTVTDGGKVLASKKYTEQKSNEIFTDSVKLSDVKPGSKITVALVCNIMGSAKETVTVK